MAGDRSADQIENEIKASRAALADAVEELTRRGSPKTLMQNAKNSLREKAQTPQGKAVLGAVGGLVLIVVIRRVRKH